MGYRLRVLADVDHEPYQGRDWGSAPGPNEHEYLMNESDIFG